MSTLRLYRETVRHLAPQQTLGRLAFRPRRMLARLMSSHRGAVAHGLPQSMQLGAHDASNNREDLLKGDFRFLEVSRSLGSPIDWNPDAPLLWRFNLHYFDYLYLLEPDEQDAIRRSWIESNPVSSSSVAWHPYPTSLRIVNWCRCGSQDPSVLASLERQIDYLSRCTETHIQGNHLLENARALVVGGAYFGGVGRAARWLARGVELYDEQTPIQILPDGAHYERSPMYHALVLAGYLDLVAVLGDNHERSAYFREVAHRMLGFLRAMTRPDGSLAQFNDCAAGISLPTDELERYASELAIENDARASSFAEAGYYRERREEGFDVIVDAGPLGPDNLLAHAHADIFSYELYFRNCPFVVDTGVSDYASGETRQFERGTAAHSTVQVDGADQAELWASFRVARRFPPSDVALTRQAEVSRFSGSFSGYAQLVGDGIEVCRVIEVSDAVIIVADTVAGAGHHRLESRVTLHPEVVISRDADTVVLERDGIQVAFITMAGTLTIEDGWYSPRFGTRVPRKVLVVTQDADLPAKISYRFEPK